MNAERAAALETALRSAGCLRYRGNISHTGYFNNPAAADVGIAKLAPLATKVVRGQWRVGGIEVEFFHSLPAPGPSAPFAQRLRASRQTAGRGHCAL